MEVKLKHCTPLEVAVAAGLICTANLGKVNETDHTAFIKRLIDKGHTSVLEHIVYTFHITGITRGLLLELERHRNISMSVESTRWALKKILKDRGGGFLPIDLEWMAFSAPADVLTPEQREAFIDAYKASYYLEEAVISLINAGVANDKIKPFLQEGLKTNLYLTTNARELRHIITLRSQPDVYPEFRELAKKLKMATPSFHWFMYPIAGEEEE
jgi:thymidylate synthase (FAD)